MSKKTEPVLKQKIELKRLLPKGIDPWNVLAKADPLSIFAKATKPWGIFSKEAERWYRITTRFKLPGSPVQKASQKRLRLTFNNKQKSILSKLVYLYGEERGKAAFERIGKKMISFRRKKPKRLKYKDAHFEPLNRFTQKDVILMTYPDSLQKKGVPPLQTLRKFSRRLKDTINTIHILPFYPYSSDRGFSVINYKKVDKRFGTWEDVRALGEDFNLMFDGVLNHVSSKSLWFRSYLRGKPQYENHFIAFDTKDAISNDNMDRIVRPRTSDLLSEFRTKQGKIYVWTTFSRDQVDLNYKEPKILLRVVDVLFRYVANGAAQIRLDAINYLWKEVGTSCVHLKQTHVIIQLLRDILDIVAPSVSLVTETNVPHARNISYFGNGRNEAQMVYNFALPPLVLYSFYKGSAKYLSRWADRLERVSKYCTYFNFLASHDGIGLSPAKRVLPLREVRFLIAKAKRHGSLVQNKTFRNGKVVPYELNITWWNAINNDNGKESQEIQIRRYMASRAVALSLKGVPGVYIHGLFGTRNDSEAVVKSQVNRDINRKDLMLAQLKKELASQTQSRKIFERLIELIRTRVNNKAFHPNAEQKILMQNEGIFSLLRTSIDKKEKILVLINVTGTFQNFTVNTKRLGISNTHLYDLVNKRRILAQFRNIRVNNFDVRLRPYETVWIKSVEGKGD